MEERKAAREPFNLEQFAAKASQFVIKRNAYNNVKH